MQSAGARPTARLFPHPFPPSPPPLSGVTRALPRRGVAKLSGRHVNRWVVAVGATEAFVRSVARPTDPIGHGWQVFGRELRVCLKKRVSGNWERLQKPEVTRPQNERYDFDYVQDSSEDDVRLATCVALARVGPT